MKKNKDNHASAMLVQQHQVSNAENKLSKLDSALNELRQSQGDNESILDSMVSDMEDILYQNNISFSEDQNKETFKQIESKLQASSNNDRAYIPQLDTIEKIQFNCNMSWDEYVSSVDKYAFKHSINLTSDPYQQLMSDTQRIKLEKRIKNEFTLRTANCDKYDYMIAGTCGVIGGLIDVFFVGLPGEGKLTKLTDSAVDGVVEKFAGACGWDGGRDGSDSTKSAIGFLERKYKVNYDHRHGGDVDGLFKMSTKNHHIKSLGHSPDLIGLFFSILSQFTNTAYFVDSGKLIAVDTENFELQGSNFVSKVFAGFVNWIGHLFSDIAGSSGASGRGSGIPIPFYSLLQFLEIGEFGQHRQSFAKIAVQVFEKGYDFRHGLAMAIPVIVTELLTRIMWVIKQRTYHQMKWKECIPLANNPELRRMLLVAHGSLCIVDIGDAAIRSGGEMIQFLLRTNIIGWAMFGTLALRESYAWYNAGHVDADAVDDYLDAEYKKMLTK